MAETAENSSFLFKILPLVFVGLSVPLSTFFWIGNITLNKLGVFTNVYDEDPTHITPFRWLISFVLPLALMVVGYRRKGVNKSGAVLGFIMAVILTIANLGFLICLAGFFFSSTYATKYKSKHKEKLEEDHKEGGQRNWIQALCNAGMATQLALLYLLDCGSGERPIDFKELYRASWLQIAVMSAFACSNGDTWASELGTVLARGDPYLITTRKRVPRGTNGGVSLPGLVVSFLGGQLIGVVFFLSTCYFADMNSLSRDVPQWPLIFVGGIAGLFGSLVDSLLGATLQYSGIDNQGHIVERPGKNVRNIAGHRILDNHSVNLISSIITGIIMPTVAKHFWNFFT